MIRLLFLLFFLQTFLLNSFAESDSTKVKDYLESAKHLITTNKDSSLYFYKQALRLSGNIDDKQWLILSIKKTGLFYHKQSNYDSSIVYWNKIISLTDLNNNSFSETEKQKNISEAYQYIGMGNYYKGNYTTALDNNLLALRIFKNINDSLGIANSFDKIGMCYLQQGYFPKALTEYGKALNIYELLNNKQKTALIYDRIAVLYSIQGNFEESETYDLKALEIYKELNVPRLLSNSYINLGILMLRQDKYKEGISYLKKATLINKQEKNLYGLANVYNNLGVAYQKTNRLDSSYFYYKSAMQTYLDLGSKGNLTKAYTNLASLFIDKKEYPKSIDYAKRSIKLSEEIGSASRKRLAYMLISKAYEGNGQIAKAFKAYKIYNQLNDSIFNIEKAKAIQSIETKYQTERKNQEIKILNTKNEQQETEISAKKQELSLWIGISVLAFIFASVSVYFFLNKKKISDKLAQKNKLIEKTLSEKDVLLREIHHRVKNNLQIISSLLNMQSRFLDDKKSKSVLAESQNRIKSMSLIHQKLYQEENLTGIETTSYFTELIDSLSLSYGINKTKVKMKIDIENLSLDVDTAIPLGLILNEIISNAFKYGVDPETGVFKFSFKKISDTELLLKVKDNGAGIPEDFNIRKSKSYGMKLIQSLSKKLKAEVTFENNKGLEITMKILKFKIAE